MDRRNLLKTSAALALTPPGAAAAAEPVFVIAREVGATGDGSTDDWNAIRAATSNPSLAFGPGVYRVGRDLTIPPTCSLLFFNGAVLRPDRGVTITIDGPFLAGLHRTFDVGNANARVVFGPASVTEVRPEWWHDGGAYYTNAIRAAMLSLPVNGVPIRFAVKVYPCEPITVPTVAGRSVAVCFEGDGGGGGDRKPEIRFTGAGGLDFRDAGDSVRLARLQINHALPSAASNGIGLHLGAATYAELEELWITNFDICIQQSGYCFYSRWHSVRALYGHSACVRWDAAVHNGNAFENCQFTGSRNGTGLLINGSGGSAGVCFRSCKFEGNHGYGFFQNSTGFINVRFDSCYAEHNGQEDFYIESVAPNASSLVSFDNCYFDPANANPTYPPHRRIRVRGSRMTVTNCRFYQMVPPGGQGEYRSPPIWVTEMRGSQPCVALNNDYGSASLVNDETGWLIVDSKHPLTGHSAMSPDAATFHALKAGSFFFNTDEATAARTLGWTVERSGRSATALQPDLTATAVRQSSSITPGTNEHVLAAGDHVELGTVTFDRRDSGGTQRDPFARVIEVRVGSVLLDGSANESARDVPVRYRSSLVSAVPRSARSLDGVVVASGRATSFPLAGSGYALLTIAEVGATKSSAIVMASSGRLFIVFQDAARYAVGSNIAGRINLSLGGGTVTVQNLTGADNVYSVTQTVTH